MPQFQHTFTGKDTAVEIKPLDNRSQERMDDFIVKAEELKLKAFKENEKYYLDKINISPKAYISQANTQAQAELLQAYNDQAKEILKRNGGLDNLSLEDKAALQRGRTELESAQSKMDADLKRFELDEAVIKKDAGMTYDLDEWQKRRDDYFKKGNYPEDPLPIKEKSFLAYLGGVRKRYNGKVQTQPFALPEKGVRRTGWFNMTVEQAQEEIKQGILLNEAERKNVTNTFTSLPATEQIKWLDQNKDGQVNKADGEQENAIISWAQNYEPYVNAVMEEDSSMYTGIPSGKGGGLSFNFGGASQKYDPTEAMQTRLGSTFYNAYHSFPNWRPIFIPSEDIEVFNLNGNKEKSTATSIKVVPTGYDEETDEFSFYVLSDYYGRDNNKGSGDRIALKRGELPPEFGNIYIISGGKPVMIKDIQKSPQATSTTQSARDRMKDLANKAKNNGGKG